MNAMKCFPWCHRGVKKEEKNIRTTSVPITNSTLTDLDFKEFSSEVNSQNVSGTSTDTDSMGRTSIPYLSQRSSNLRVFAFSEMKLATKNFSRTSKIGEGGFGCVYKGMIKSSEDPQKKLDIAVKQLGKRGHQGHKEWVNEVNFLGIVEHPNLVKLLGYCSEDDERGIQRLLVYEYMPNGSVEDHLSSRVVDVPLTWVMRLKVARDAAKGLAHLHEGMEFQIIFRDFKSSNILLDEEWNAKLSDFGLARLGPEEGFTHVSTGVVGTLGYAAPEYMQTGHLTSKSDVWGYGVFLFELITGRRPLDRNRPSSEQNLLVWIRPYVQDTKKFHQILDPRLDWKDSLKSAYKLASIANKCLNRHAKSRLKMSEVSNMVNEIFESFKDTTSLDQEESKEMEGEKKPGEDSGWFSRFSRMFR